LIRDISNEPIAAVNVLNDLEIKIGQSNDLGEVLVNKEKSKVIGLTKKKDTPIVGSS
jgi:hypothetical protein